MRASIAPVQDADRNRALLLAAMALALSSACGSTRETQPVSAETVDPDPLSGDTVAAPVAPAEPLGESCTVTVECGVFGGGPTEASATAPTHVEACQRAAETARTGSCNVVSIDGVSVGWIVSPSDDALPSGSLDHEVACELVIVEAVSPAVVGHGRGETEPEARATAVLEACGGMGATDCSEASGFFTRVTRRNTSMRMENGQTSTTSEVELTLRRGRLVEGRGASRRSRAEACRLAYRSACGDDGCSADDRLLTVDGVRVERD